MTEQFERLGPNENEQRLDSLISEKSAKRLEMCRLEAEIDKVLLIYWKHAFGVYVGGLITWDSEI